jgi:hypothetical protein
LEGGFENGKGGGEVGIMKGMEIRSFSPMKPLIQPPKKEKSPGSWD